MKALIRYSSDWQADGEPKEFGTLEELTEWVKSFEEPTDINLSLANQEILPDTWEIYVYDYWRNHKKVEV